MVAEDAGVECSEREWEDVTEVMEVEVVKMTGMEVVEVEMEEVEVEAVKVTEVEWMESSTTPCSWCRRK